MEPIDSAYVTQHNFKRLSKFWLQPDGDISIDKIFQTIYDKPLSEILNHQEAASLYVQKQMMNKQLDSIRIEKKPFNPKYIFSVAPPKFHKDKECTFLKSDFINYLVPPAIEALGENKVREFQDYCETHKKELEDKSDDVFWALIGAKFNVHVAPQAIRYENSGTHDIESMSIESLQSQINEYIDQIFAMLKGESREKSIDKFKYAPSLKFALSKISDETVKEQVKAFFSLKQALISSLFELYKKQGNLEDFILPVTLLKACGIEPCKGCSS